MGKKSSEKIDRTEEQEKCIKDMILLMISIISIIIVLNKKINKLTFSFKQQNVILRFKFVPNKIFIILFVLKKRLFVYCFKILLAVMYKYYKNFQFLKIEKHNELF